MWRVPSRWEAQTPEHHGGKLEINVDYFSSNSLPTLDKGAETQNATVQKDQVVLLTGRRRVVLTALLFLELPFASPGHLRSHPASQLCQQVSQGLL